jgi:PST family polysaccharide transporter
MGGAYVLNYVVGLVRMKVVAVLLGPAGVGLISLYTSSIGMIGAVSSLGIGTSGVREIAHAHQQNDSFRTSETVHVLRRACWAAGLLGWTLAAVLAEPISIWVLGSREHSTAVAVLGVTLLLGALSGGQGALLQAMRRIGDLARISIVGTLINTAVAIGLYAWLGERGIVPVLVAMALVSLAVSWWFARRIQVESATLSWLEAIAGASRLVKLGAAVMWSGLLAAGLDLLTRAVITREYGIDAAGMYQAAWILSGVFAGFILNAMGTEFFPRLSGIIHEHATATRVVNEQAEIGILLALPGLLGTLAFAPLVMELFYSERFLPGAHLLPWLLLGVCGRIVSWPLGYILLAKGASRLYVGAETAFAVVQMSLIVWLVPSCGVVGAAYSSVVAYAVYAIGLSVVASYLIGFTWSKDVKALMAIAGLLVIAGVAVRSALPEWQGLIVGSLLLLAASAMSVRGLSARLGSENRLARLCRLVPGGKWLVGRQENGSRTRE